MDSKTLSTSYSANKALNLVIGSLLLLTPALSVVSGLALAPLLTIIILLGLALYLPNIKEWQLTPFKPLPIRITLIFLLWALLGAIWAIDSGSAIHLWGKLAFLFIGGAIILAVFKPRFDIALYAVCFALVILAVERISNGAITTFTHQDISKKASFNYSIDELNRGATVIALFIWPALWVVMRKGYRKMAFLLWAVAAGLLLSLGSLSALTGLAAGSFCFLLVLVVKEKALNGLIVLALIGIAITPPLMLFQKPKAIMQQVPQIPASCEHRLYIWQFTSHKALEHAWRGWGLNASRHITILPAEMLPNNQSPLPIHPHNNITQLWLELGIPGLLLFAAFISSLLWKIRKLPTDITHKAAYASSLIAYLVVGYTAFGIWQEWWIAAGFLLALSLRNIENSAQAQN